ncbi:type 3 dihydrofolate reductase [Alteromonas sp. C1M14]|nr:type 3 dihydrofolate reductase [Alteromonas sp. C1M14]
MIAAMAENRVIGADNDMPWHLPADLKHFKSVTLGKPVIMGRKTYASIGKPLPGRPNIVISSQPASSFPASVTVVKTPQEALNHAVMLVGEQDEVMIIGGGAIYNTFLPLADVLYLTFIKLQTEGDTVFPDYTQEGAWQEVSRESHCADEKNAYDYEFVTLQRS